MPTVRVFLECSSPTLRPWGLYDTFVTVSDEGWAAGEHLRIASRRAAILGYGGPHVVREVRRLDVVAVAEQGGPAVQVNESPTEEAERQVARLARLIAEAESEGAGGLPTDDTELHGPPSSPQPASTRRGRATVG